MKGFSGLAAGVTRKVSLTFPWPHSWIAKTPPGDEKRSAAVVRTEDWELRTEQKMITTP
jgi:hypothetical protein